MRDLIRSMVNLSVAMPLLAMKQAGDLWRGRGSADSLAGELDTLTDAVKGQLEGTAKDVYEGGEKLQSQVFGPRACGEAQLIVTTSASRRESRNG